MDFDKCEEDGFEEDEDQYNFQMNKHSILTNDSLENHFVHFDPHMTQQRPGEEVIFIHDAQLHTYIINNKDPLQQHTSSDLQNETLYYQQHNNVAAVGMVKQIKQSDDDGANLDNSSKKNKKNHNREHDERQNNDTVNDDDDEDEVLIYDTQL